MVQWIGIVIVIAGCGGVGLKMAMQSRQQEQNLNSLIAALGEMENELEFRMPALPELCRSAAKQAGGPIGQLLLALAEALGRQAAPNVSTCMEHLLEDREEMDPELQKLLGLLGTSLGRFDLTGQLAGLNSLKQQTQQALNRHVEGQQERVRSYQTLGLCAGAALAILLI